MEVCDFSLLVASVHFRQSLQCSVGQPVDALGNWRIAEVHDCCDCLILLRHENLMDLA